LIRFRKRGARNNMNSSLGHLRSAAKKALRFRVEHGYQLDEPCNIYELIHKQRIDLQFVDVPSLEGMYLEEESTNRICVCAHRPVGRQKFTAAHELGHHVLGHGSQIDAGFEIDHAVPDDLEERTADVFARYVLMPPRAVYAGFRGRGLDPTSARPEDFYRIGTWLGVGFVTLVYHMTFTLQVLSRAQCHMLEKVELRDIKRALAGAGTTFDVWQLDKSWAGMMLHAQLGDFIIGVTSGQERKRLLMGSDGEHWIATTIGTSEYMLADGPSVTISVSRRNFAGFYDYRYLQE
jgi:Zn-dependent peptidase ImmA (M78 family)